MLRVPAHGRREHLGIAGAGEREELVDLVRADVDEDAAVGRGIEEPRRPVLQVQGVRPETDRVHDLADPSLFDDPLGAEHRRRAESLAEDHEIPATGLALHVAYGRELRGRGDARLVGDHVLAGAHRVDRDLRAFARNCGGHHDIHIVAERIVGARVRILGRQPRTDAFVGRHERDDACTGPDESLRQLDDVRVISTDDR